ncbi:hypothetical protein NL676_029724 [Syzygium grande]|nr:hypothetical protein NL676_029724 [Syzygium grande]
MESGLHAFRLSAQLKAIQPIIQLMIIFFRGSLRFSSENIKARAESEFKAAEMVELCEKRARGDRMLPDAVIVISRENDGGHRTSD